MRYELDENGYICKVFFGCLSGTCTKYEGEIPAGYTTLEEWVQNANIRAYKIVDGNLTHDAERDAQLLIEWQTEWEKYRPPTIEELDLKLDETNTATQEKIDLLEEEVVGNYVTKDEAQIIEEKANDANTAAQNAQSKADQVEENVANNYTTKQETEAIYNSTTQYAAWLSDTDAGKISGWQNTCPATTIAYPYIWTRELITWSDSTTTTTEPQYNSALTKSLEDARQASIEALKATSTANNAQGTANLAVEGLETKVGNDEVIYKINSSSEGTAIAPDKYTLEGKTTANGGFGIDEDGNATLNNATITGGKLDLTSSGIIDPKFRVYSETDGTKYAYITSDALKIEGNDQVLLATVTERGSTQFGDLSLGLKHDEDGSAETEFSVQLQNGEPTFATTILKTKNKTSGNIQSIELDVDGSTGETKTTLVGDDGTTELSSKRLKIELKPTHDFTSSDTSLVADYIAGTATLTEEQIALYDLNKNGVVDSEDYTDIYYWYLNRNKVTTTDAGSVEIDSTNSVDTIAIKDKDKNRTTSIGLNGILTNDISTSKLKVDGIKISQPIGSVIITSTNEDPNHTYGGTWELIDKEFSFAEIKGAFTINTTNTTSADTAVIRAGHSITVTGLCENKVAWTDTSQEIGQFKLADIGVSTLPDIFRFVGYSDNGNSMVQLVLNTLGTLSKIDVEYNLTSVAKGNTWYFSFTTVADYNAMLDEACNKFYWKRIA